VPGIGEDLVRNEKYQGNEKYQASVRPWYSKYFYEGAPLTRTITLNEKTTSALRAQVTMLGKKRVLSKPRRWKLLAKEL